MMFEVIPVTEYRVNCSILWCERTGRGAVIDPGGELDEIQNFMEILEVEPDLVLITHGHFDHAGRAVQFARLIGARIEGPHRGDRPDLQSLEKLGAQHGSRSRGFEPDRWLNHGDEVRFGEVSLDVLHCPGHCPGHVAYFHKERRQAFVGDILFRGAIGAWQGAGGSLPQLITSIRDRLFPLGDDVAFVPGHGPASTFGRERRENPFVGDAAYATWLQHTVK